MAGLYDLVTLSQVQTALPRLTAAQIAGDIPALITQVSAACETVCRRPLALRSFDKLYRPGMRRKFYLHSWPVIRGARFKTDLFPVMTIQNTSALNQFARVDPAPVSTTSLGIQSLTLYRNSSGVEASPVVLTLASYPTVQNLADAVNALGNGWNAIVQSPFGSYATSEITYDPGSGGAMNQPFELRMYVRDIGRYVLHPDTGEVELTENIAQPYRYPDRVWGSGYGWSWNAAAEPRHADVRAIYRAGWATQSADIAAGYDPVPDDLARAVILSIQATLNATASPDRQTEADGAASYTLVEGGPVVIPPAARQILSSSKYSSFRLR